MSLARRIGTAALLLALGIAALELGGLAIPGLPGVVPEANAIVGRPLTPVSYAGVARRTARRCVGGVYYC